MTSIRQFVSGRTANDITVEAMPNGRCRITIVDPVTDEVLVDGAMLWPAEIDALARDNAWIERGPDGGAA